MREGGHYREIAAVQLYGDDEEERGVDRETLPSHMDRVRDLDIAAAPAPAGAPDERPPLRDDTHGAEQ
jgi:hypothetical protein